MRLRRTPWLGTCSQVPKQQPGLAWPGQGCFRLAAETGPLPSSNKHFVTWTHIYYILTHARKRIKCLRCCCLRTRLYYIGGLIQSLQHGCQPYTARLAHMCSSESQRCTVCLLLAFFSFSSFLRLRKLYTVEWCKHWNQCTAILKKLAGFFSSEEFRSYIMSLCT